MGVCAGMQDSLVREALSINQTAGFEELEDDEMVNGDSEADGGLASALSVLHRMVEAARLHEGAEGRRWQFRSAHLGAGVCSGMTSRDLLRAFLLWSQTEEDRQAACFNVSKAFRRVSKFASFSEKHFERYFREPLTMDDPAYPLVSSALQVPPKELCTTRKRALHQKSPAPSVKGPCKSALYYPKRESY